MIHIYLIFTLHFQYLKLGLQKNEAGLKGGLQWRFTRKYIYIYTHTYIYFSFSGCCLRLWFTLGNNLPSVARFRQDPIH